MVIRPYVQIINLGVTKYSYSLQLQQHFARKLLDYHVNHSCSEASNTMLIQQHYPVYTIGLRSKEYMPDLQCRLEKIGAEFYQTNRGGLITFHGPGQLVAYPILYLKEFSLSMRDYVDRLENTVIDMCAHYGIEGSKSPHTGVWVGSNKIAAIGKYNKL